jgi:hypothetical protein
MTLLLPMLALATVFSTNPFRGDATISWGHATPLPVMPLAAWRVYWQDHQPEGDPFVWPALSATVCASYNPPEMGIAASTESTADPFLLEQDYAHPPTASALDWSTVIEIDYGIQIEDLDRYCWENTNFPTVGAADARMLEALNHVRRTMQIIHASFLRDFGVALKIAHVHILNDRPPIGPLNDTGAVWRDTIVPRMAAPIQGIMRLTSYSGGYSDSGTCLTDFFGSPIAGRASYDFTVVPSVFWSNTVAHEMGHQLLRMRHSQCYRISGGATGVPVERCTDGANGCYPGPTVCPAPETVGWMGYCLGCMNAATTALRIGPWNGPMSRIGRWNAEVLAATCLPASTVTTVNPADFTLDTDADAMPDMLDNCPVVANPLQTDANMDGYGDACTPPSCAIAPGRHVAAWALVLPLVLGALRKVTRRNTAERSESFPMVPRLAGG